MESGAKKHTVNAWHRQITMPTQPLLTPKCALCMKKSLERKQAGYRVAVSDYYKGKNLLLKK
jgi:hypothetical protein